MIRFGWLLFFILISFCSLGQIRLAKKVLAKGERFEILETDIAVIDTLVMSDSSILYLNAQKKDNFIHAKVLKVGKGCQIIGVGKPGKPGKNGDQGEQLGGPCRTGLNGLDGAIGEAGLQGINLSLYLGKVVLDGTLTINLTGGNGGDGGRGGNGGDGSPGTRVCPGGDGGRGGNGGNGADGGNAGSLLIQYKEGPDLRLIQNELLFVKVYGGFSGVGGDGGLGGQAGLGPARDGKNGPKGIEGKTGKQGKEGIVKFERKL